MPSLFPGYECDIFISYRQNDNHSGWVTEFVKALEAELSTAIKDPVSIYFDANPHDGLLETHNVDKSLEGKLKCLIFIPIISQTYCDSKSFAWQHEFCAFNKVAQADQVGRDIKLSTGNVASRILPIKIHDLDAEDKAVIEAETGSVLRGIEFIFRSAGVNRPLAAHEEHPQDNLNKTFYRDQINKVANSVKELIQGIRNPGVLPTARQEGETIPVSKPARKILAAMSLLILIVLIAAYFIMPSRVSTWLDTTVADKSVAVLAFDDISPNHDQGYFGDGIAEELIFTLSKVRDLKVAGRHSAFSFKNKNIDLRQVGTELGVSTVLTGSVRRSGNMIRVFVQLVNVRDGFQLWSEQYDKELINILSVQQDIAQAVINSLQVSDAEGPIAATRRLLNGEAYEVYLKARQKLALRGAANLLEARSLFEEAIKFDPTFSPAHSGLGRVFTILPYYTYSISAQEAVAEGSKAVKAALALDPTNAEAYAVKGTLAGFYEWDWKVAGESLEKAYSMAPQNAEIVNFLGDYFRQTLDPRMFRTEELAIAMDPLRSINYSDLGSCYLLRGDHLNAAVVLRRAFEMDPMAYAGTSRNLVYCYLTMDSLEAAKVIIARIKALNEDGSRDILLKDLNLRVSLKKGVISDSTDVLSELESLARLGRYEPVYVGELFALAGNKRKVIEMLELAYTQRSFLLVVAPMAQFQSIPEVGNVFNRPGLMELTVIRKKNESN